MHIPDAYLSPSTQLVAAAAVAPLLGVGVRKTRATLSSKQVPLLSVGAAFCFAIQMFNIPAIGGTTAHALGTVMLAILLGPWAAMITMTLTLAIQALFFGDGGILSLGVNALDMAVVPAFLGYWLYRSIARDDRTRLVAAAVASYAGTATASLSAGLILGLQPLIAHDLIGHALYFPFDWSVSIPAMVYTHLLIAAPAEAIITVFALTYLWRNFPDLAHSEFRSKAGSKMKLGLALAAVLILTPIGLLASGGAWGEWDAQTVKNLVGYIPAGVANSKELIHPLLPDYGLPNAQGHIWEILGYLVSALIGAGLVAVATRVVVKGNVRPQVREETRLAPSVNMPAWLKQPNHPLRPAMKASKPWIEALLLRMRSTIEETVATEHIARQRGFLQSLNGIARSTIALISLVGIACIVKPSVLLLVFGVVTLSAGVSKVPLVPFLGRILSAVAFFGIVIAAPLSFAAITPGRVVLGSGQLALSDTGLGMAAVILLRLACGISVTVLWTLTSRWHELVGSLRTLGLPAFFCTTITLAYRYLFVTIQTLEEMAVARRSRQCGQVDKAQARSYSGAGAAILFGKSQAFTEDLHMAMQSRSLDCGTVSVKKRKWSRPEVAHVACSLAVVLLIGGSRFV